MAIDRLGSATGLGITASFGVSGTDGAEIDFERLYRSADQALYQAKRGGRDRVTVSSTPTSTPTPVA